ncbi:hypothetical protein [Streptomyces sp. URMC 129]|uniref:hypothetical protein n=1 Tax=Streptomyces sp. URMC 129 TaxID=3423407 RepID=UPI003F1C143E
MSMTRHLVNRRRRLAARTDTPPQPPERDEQKQPKRPKEPKEPKERKPKPEREAREPRSGKGILLPAILGLVAVVLGVFALWANAQADSIKDDPALRNTALSDTAATSEVIGTVSDAMNELFSYDYGSPETNEEAAEKWLTGDAVEQHEQLLGPVREAGQEQPMVLTTTVTHAGVEVLEGDRARVLVYADQSSSTTDDPADTLYGPAVLTVEAVQRDGEWLIAGIEAYGG